jgi:hypothetical protein
MILKRFRMQRGDRLVKNATERTLTLAPHEPTYILSGLSNTICIRLYWQQKGKPWELLRIYITNILWISISDRHTYMCTYTSVWQICVGKIIRIVRLKENCFMPQISNKYESLTKNKFLTKSVIRYFEITWRIFKLRTVSEVSNWRLLSG